MTWTEDSNRALLQEFVTWLVEWEGSIDDLLAGNSEHSDLVINAFLEQRKKE